MAVCFDANSYEAVKSSRAGTWLLLQGFRGSALCSGSPSRSGRDAGSECHSSTSKVSSLNEKACHAVETIMVLRGQHNGREIVIIQ